MKLQIGIDGKTYEVDVEVQDDDPRSMNGYIPPYSPASTVTVPPAPVTTSAPKPLQQQSTSDKVCRSPMAGIVVRINTQVGQEIHTDDLLMVLEAMKMETNITAPLTGKVKSILVEPGDAVQVNQVLVEFE